MPIYSYRCSSCGLHKDVMQKISDAPLSACPQCGNETFVKQLTAAGFQLKGSGYYATDFRGGPKRLETGKQDSEGMDSGKPAEAKPEAGTGAAAAPAGSVSTA